MLIKIINSQLTLTDQDRDRSKSTIDYMLKISTQYTHTQKRTKDITVKQYTTIFGTFYAILVARFQKNILEMEKVQEL